MQAINNTLPARSHDKPLTIGLAGQPNVGKTTVFNLLTGLNQHVGNWSGKTVERKEGSFTHQGRPIRIVDLPGTYSLTSNSDEERVTRSYILHEQPDVVVMIADATALERNLYLLAELLVLPAPIVLGINMFDVAQGQGLTIEPHVLEAALGIPVIPMTASKNKGVTELVEAVEKIVENPTLFTPSLPKIASPHDEVLAHVISLIQGHIPQPYSDDWVALKLLEGDTEITQMAKTWVTTERWSEVEAILHEHEDAILDIVSGRYEWIGRMMRAAVTNPPLGQISFTDRFDKFAVHPLWGISMLLSIFALVFFLTFTVATPVQDALDQFISVNISDWSRNALSSSPPWVSSLLVDGMLAGVGIVITFIPILVVFFASLGFLEDTGYLARTAYVMDRFMHSIGLHGKSFLSLFLSFGCNVPAVIGSRVIDSRKGRLLTILLIPLVPCSARLVVVAFMVPIFFSQNATLVAWGLITMNIVILALVGLILSRTLFKGETAAFIMELPLYHKPNARTIAMYVRNNVWDFIRNATSIILVVSVLIWTLGHFPGPDLDASYLAMIGRVFEPIGELMGMDWRMIVAMMTSFIAKENAIATMGIIYASGDQADTLVAAIKAVISPASALSFLVVTMLFIPCVSTMVTIRRETKSFLWTLLSFVMLLVIAVVGGIVTYQGALALGI